MWSWWKPTAGRVSESLAILPVLRGQLRETSQQVEEAVVNVCGHFSGMAARARKAVSRAAEVLGDTQEEHNATVERSIETSRAAIGQLLERLERAGQLSTLAISRMDEIEQTMHGMESLLHEVQRTSFASKLVALNAKIEAVHVGQLGSGFEVVAEEISRQADTTSQLADGIFQRIIEMRRRVGAAASDLREFVDHDRRQLAETRQGAETALDMLWAVHQRARESLSVMTAEGTQLADEIAGAVVGLQFQDRVSQRVEHVVEALEKVERSLGRQSPGEGSSLVADVHAAYTMKAERSVMARLSGESASATAEPDSGVELF